MDDLAGSYYRTRLQTSPAPPVKNAPAITYICTQLIQHNKYSYIDVVYSFQCTLALNNYCHSKKKSPTLSYVLNFEIAR